MDTRCNNVKAILRQQLSLFLTVTHPATQIMHRHQQKGESIWGFKIESSELIQALTNCEPNDITDLLKM